MSSAVTPLSDPPSSRLNSLTGMRGIAAVMVFVCHGAMEFLFRDQHLNDRFLFYVGNLGSAVVSFFFILSGFVLTWSLRPQDSTKQFWRRRFFKVFPNHLVTFVLAVVLLLLAGRAVLFPQTLANLFLVQSWVPEHSYMDSANGVSWSLSVEVLCYLSFPLLLRLVDRIRPDRLWYMAGAVVALVIAVPAIALAFLPDTPVWPWGPASWMQIWFVYVFPLTRSLEFVLGIVLARIVMTGRWIGLGFRPAVGLLAVGYLASLYLPVHFLYDYAAMTVIPLALLVPAAAMADVKGRKTLMSTRLMVWLGEISFALYLVHWQVIGPIHRAFGQAPNAYGMMAGPQWSTPVGIAFLVATFTISVIAAWGLYTFVERPAMRRWSEPATPARPERETDAVTSGS